MVMNSHYLLLTMSQGSLGICIPGLDVGGCDVADCVDEVDFRSAGHDHGFHHDGGSDRDHHHHHLYLGLPYPRLVPKAGRWEEGFPNISLSMQIYAMNETHKQYIQIQSSTMFWILDTQPCS